MSNFRQTGRLPAGYDLDPAGLRPTYDKVYLGFVRDHKDFQFMGRLRVWIPELSTDNENSWIVVDHASPFAGATNVLNVNNNPQSAQTSYGMSFIPPDQNNQVLCMFINADPNRGIWFACMFQTNRRDMVPSVPGGGPTNPAQRTEENIISGEAAQWYPGVTPAEYGGTFNIPVRDGGNVSRSAGNSYTSNGILTPRGHNLVMDDDPEDGFIRLKTRHGVQIILHDNADRVIINNAFSSGKIVIDHDGKIDVYGEGSISINSLDNINISAKNDVNIESREGQINIRSSSDIKAYAKNEWHLVTGSNMFQTSQQGEIHVHANSNLFLTADRKVQRIGRLGINDTVRQGNINISNEEGNIFLYTRDGDMHFRSYNNLFLQSVTGNANLKSATAANIQSDDAINIKAGGNMFVQGNGDINLRAGAAVKTGAITEINNSALPAAGEADTALPAAVAIAAIAGSEPQTRLLEQPAPDNLRNPGSRTQLVTSIASRMPSGDPYIARNTAGPGYSGTDTIQRKDAPVEGTFKTGQIFEGQSIPLVVNGKTAENSEEGKYEGKGWQGDKPAYGAKMAVSEGVFRPASQYEKVSARGLNAIKEHEGNGAGPPNIPGGVFENACKTGIKMIGHGHVLTSAELAEPYQININGSIETGGSPRVVNATVNWQNTALTDDQMLVLLQKDLEPVYSKIKATVGGARITQDQFDALTDFIFNVGTAAFDKSGIAGMINGGKYDEVPTEMIKWILACGTEKSELRARRINNAFTFSGTVRAGAFAVYTGQGRVNPAATSERAAKAMSWFQSAAGGGFSCNQAAGIVANLIEESGGLNPAIVNPISGATGLAQWLGSRKTRYINTYGSFPSPGSPFSETAFENQLKYVTQELTVPVWPDGTSNYEYRRAGIPMRRGGAGANEPVRQLSAVENAELFRVNYERNNESPGSAYVQNVLATARGLSEQYCGGGRPAS